MGEDKAISEKGVYGSRKDSLKREMSGNRHFFFGCSDTLSAPIQCENSNCL